MGLRLQSVAARQGWLWARDGARLYLRRPISFTAMFALYMLATVFCALLPVVGVVALAGLPLLSLGFMVASRSVLRGGPAHVRQFVEPLMGDPQRRRNLLLLCALYGACAFGVVTLATWVFGNALDALQDAITAHGPLSPEAQHAKADPRMTLGTLSLALLLTAMSIPFWHAPALVWWGGHGVWQALFSSTIGVWRAKAAYLVYGLAWLSASMTLSLLIGIVAGALGATSLLAPLATALLLALSTAFYVSLWFSFVDNFGSPDDDAPQAAPPPSGPTSLPSP